MVARAFQSLREPIDRVTPASRRSFWLFISSLRCSGGLKEPSVRPALLE